MKNLIIVFLFLLSSLLLITFFVGVSEVNSKSIIVTRSPHVYNDSNSSIKNIHLTVFYFVPKDKSPISKDTWKEITDEHLKKLQNFHTVQFSGKSKITYTFCPVVLQGNKNTKDYELSSEDDDPDSLILIKKEIEERVFAKQGDLYLNYMAMKQSEPAFPLPVKETYLIVFEGSGGAGKDDFSIISRAYLSDKAYEKYSTTFLAHEFYHTLGIPDNYKKSTYVYNDGQQKTISLIVKKDIMGRVDTPITNTYIDRETLKKMGL